MSAAPMTHCLRINRRGTANSDRKRALAASLSFLFMPFPLAFPAFLHSTIAIHLLLKYIVILKLLRNTNSLSFFLFFLYKNVNRAISYLMDTSELVHVIIVFLNSTRLLLTN